MNNFDDFDKSKGKTTYVRPVNRTMSYEDIDTKSYICIMCTEQCKLGHKAAKRTGRSLDTIQCSV